MDFYGYYGKHKKKKETVTQTTVTQSKKFTAWFCADTWKELKEFMDSNELENKSHTVETILSDFFLDQKIKQQKADLEDI